MSSLSKIIALIGFLFLTQPAFSAPQKFSFSPDKGSTSFETKGWPSLIVIKGQGVGAEGELTAENNKLSGALTMDLTSLKTGISLRDSHMKDNYLHVKKHPKATLVFQDADLPKLDGEVKFTGELEIHGTKKTIMGTAQLNRDGDSIKVTANFPIKLSDFKIEIPSYKGITVAEDVKVKIESTVAVN